MKFLISVSSPTFRGAVDVSPFAEVCDPGSDLSRPLTSSDTVDVWICNGKEVTSKLMDLWLDHARHILKSMLVEDATIIPLLQQYANGRVVEIVRLPEQKPVVSEWEESILREAEMLYTRARSHAAIRQVREMTDMDSKKSVLLVGAGIMSLITAELLATEGYKVRVVDLGPDPRGCEDWTRLGITNGGGNARMFSYTEADNYNENGGKIYQGMKSIFRRTARNGGWSMKAATDFTPAETAWVTAFEQVPPWMATSFRENIYQVNQEAGRLWKDYVETRPELFEEVEFRQDIVRIYVEQVALDSAIEKNYRLGSMVHPSSLEEFLTANPGFRPAAASNELGGGITVQGFTVNIHPFMAKLIERITERGGEFLWNCEAQGIDRDESGQVTALRSQLGRLEANHFVLSPGVTGNKLLVGTACENQIHGVLGVWLQIPNLHPHLEHSLKIHRRNHLVEDINVTVAKDEESGEDILVLGGGYGYVGQGRPRPDSSELAALYTGLEEVARTYFPRGYAMAKESGTLYPRGQRKFCVRPFTPTGLGVFEMAPTATGGHLIITGGNNTGGFAQAPAVAQAVWRAMIGEQDPIHVLFHPDRGKLPLSIINNPTPLRDLAARQPLKLLLLCSDGPQHRYLRYRLDQLFPGYRCIQETHEGQVRHLREKGRVADACYMQYHTLRRRCCGHDRQRRAYFDRLVPEDHASPMPDLTLGNLNCREVWEAVEQWKPELTIVSGTKYIGRKLIKRAGLMINLHIGHLPEYKGNHCIFFALHDGAVDKVAATLHQLTADLDGGDVLDRVFPPILATDNEEALYARCVHAAMDRCVEHIGRVSWGEKLEFAKQEHIGRTFRHRDRTPGKELQLWWKMRVGRLLHRHLAAAKEEAEAQKQDVNSASASS
jgi:glycine/D-amino acid oxidase-like deaminating enzyme/folate-dependent phosphoribosylglycinamide formyltransferase PurN